MIGQMEKIDTIDLKILTCLQRDANMSQRDLAEEVGLSAERLLATPATPQRERGDPRHKHLDRPHRTRP